MAFNANHRRKARRLALQALYQWHLSNDDMVNIQAQFYQDNNMTKVDEEYFQVLLKNIPTQLDQLEALFTDAGELTLDQLNPIERNILRMATYEFKYRLDIPYKVVINEAVELAKSFGTAEGYKYINAVCDRLARDLRIDEIS